MGMGMMVEGEVEVGSEDVAEFLHRVYRYVGLHCVLMG